MCITKVLAIILDNKIHTKAEGAGLRANGQAAFRNGHCTLDNIFIRRTLIKQCKKRDIHRIGQEKQLYACFVDFKKAFDTVPCDLLWRAVAGMGMGPKMMHCIRSMYDTDTARVQTQTGLTNAFRCTIGVEQGCPLSPNLIGLYLDDLQAALQDTPNSDCPGLGDTALPSCFMQMTWPFYPTRKKACSVLWMRCRHLAIRSAVQGTLRRQKPWCFLGRQ